MPVMTRTRTTTTPRPEADFGAYLERLTEAAGFTQADLARVSNVNQAQLSRAYDNKVIPTIDTMRKLAPHLRVRLGDLMVRAGLASREELGMTGAPPAPGPPMPPAIRSVMSRLASPNLSDRRKQFLLQYIQEIVDKFDEITEQIDAEVEARRRR